MVPSSYGDIVPNYAALHNVCQGAGENGARCRGLPWAMQSLDALLLAFGGCVILFPRIPLQYQAHRCVWRMHVLCTHIYFETERNLAPVQFDSLSSRLHGIAIVCMYASRSQSWPQVYVHFIILSSSRRSNHLGCVNQTRLETQSIPRTSV